MVIPKLYNGRDKTFFMASYEGLRNTQQSAALSTQMPAAFFNGDFSSVPASAITGGVLKDPFNGNSPFPGNIIPANRISPIVAKLQQYYPAPTSAGLASNFSVARTKHQRYNQTVDRIDQNIGDKMRLYVRAHWQEWNIFGGNQVPVKRHHRSDRDRNYTVGYTHTLTPNLVNDFRVGRNFFKSDALNYFAVNGLKTAGTDLGIPGFTGDVAYNNPGIPDFNITGFNGLGKWLKQLVSERQHSPDLRTDQLEPGFAQHHGGLRIPPAGHWPRSCQQRARHIYVQRHADRLCSGRFHPRCSGQLCTAGPEDPRTRRRVARWIFRSRQMAGHPQADAELRHPLRTADRPVHHQRQRH